MESGYGLENQEVAVRFWALELWFFSSLKRQNRRWFSPSSSVSFSGVKSLRIWNLPHSSIWC